MLKPLIATALLLSSGWAIAAEPPLTAALYAQKLGVGMDVDWARTERGIREFDPLVVRDFRAKGISHVRIRVADEPTEARLIHLRKLVEACEQYGVIPIIAYQADSYKNDPKADNEKEVTDWWIAVAHYFGKRSPLLGFDLIYEPADKLNHNAASLNRVYEKTIKVIHSIDADRMIFIAPRLRAAPEDLPSLKLPAHSQNFLLAEWHIFPWGPLKNNGKYPWTSGTAAEKAAIHNRIATALRWQQKTGHVSWVGGWGVGESNRFTPTASQMAFATFMACELQKAKIPYAINADFQFYDGEEGAWRPAPEPLLEAMIAPACEKPGEKLGHHAVKQAARGGEHATPAAASTAKSVAPSASSVNPN
ncbi:TPA: cellulase family glycosylhydrolase [Enterobacter cloacae]|uniref:glycoside hydrolase family 5 protein n=1 Tax=Enterobacter cloacae TaxID=550 RepID=UPI000578E63F|nr:cellulase family glycosylhydrolase [Enterobacter cloacae]HCM9138903.1 cellulase family glycosylhydrolase [Enterobacter cloacae subsp. cloacae]HCT8371166.1 cellulase family glycosylhydrolase [Enterobacter cloacae]HDC4763990.1 cellulase family glycosylhydrolase [Enterobacter cloacae]HDT6535877.1 cellulase family glycosylhydrolase [Enterobacter cloacae]